MLNCLPPFHQSLISPGRPDRGSGNPLF